MRKTRLIIAAGLLLALSGAAAEAKGLWRRGEER